MNEDGRKKTRAQALILYIVLISLLASNASLVARAAKTATFEDPSPQPDNLLVHFHD